MVKITNITSRPLYRRSPSGTVIRWDAGETRDIESKRLIAQLEESNGFQVGAGVGKEGIGAGLKTHVRPSKSQRKQAKPKPKKEVKCSKRSYKCKDVCECDTVKKPKGLKKSKRAD